MKNPPSIDSGAFNNPCDTQTEVTSCPTLALQFYQEPFSSLHMTKEPISSSFYALTASLGTGGRA